MPDYKSMYFRLFNRVADAVAILQAAHQEGEDTFVESRDDTIIQLVKQQDEDENL